MRIVSIASFFLMLFCWSFEGRAQFIDADRIDQSDGLNSQYIWDISQCDKGLIWFLTYEGLNKYSINSISNLDRTPQGSYLPNQRWSRLIKTGKRNWVIGQNPNSEFKILHYEEEKWTEIQSPIASNDAYFIVDIYQEEDDVYFLSLVSHDVGADRYSIYYSVNSGFDWIKKEIPSEYGFIYHIETLADKVVIYSDTGIHYFIEELGFFDVENTFPVVERDSDRYPIAVFDLRDGRKVYKYKYEVRIYDNEQLVNVTEIPRIDGLNHWHDQFIWSDEINKPFFLFNSKLYTISDKNEVQFIQAESLPLLGWVNSIFLDMQGVLWLATERGAYKFNNVSIEYFTNDNGLNDKEVASIAPYNEDALLLGSNVGVQIFDDGKYKDFFSTQVEGLIHRVQDITEYKGEHYISAAYAGMYKLTKDKQFLKVFDKVIYTAIEFNERLFFLTQSSELYSTDGYEFKKETNYSLGKGVYIRTLYVTPNNQLWGIGRNGIINLSTGEWILSNRNYQKIGVLDIYDVHFISDTEFIYASLNGLFSYNLETKMNERALFGGDSLFFPVYAINTTSKAIWFSTDRGMAYTNDGNFLNYLSQEEGFLGADVNRNAFYENDKNGKIYVGTEFGLNAIDQSYSRKKVEPPLVHITSYKDLDSGKSFSLDNLNSISSSSDFQIEYVVSGNYDPSNIQVRYRLQESDEWYYQESSSDKRVSFHNLKEGNYQFQIQAKEIQSDWSDIASSPIFLVKVPLYQSPWFYLAVLLLLLIPVYLGIRVLWLRSREIELNTRVREQTTKIRDSQIRLQKQNNELLRMNDSLDQFTSLVSHDLKSPLNSSIGLMDLMDESYSQSELLKLNRMIQKQLVNMRNFVYELIELSRNSNQEIDDEEIDIHALVIDIFEQCERDPQLPKVDLRLYVQEQVPLKSDQARLRVLLQNLITNAVKYSNPNIELPYCEVRVDVMDNVAILAVKDNGRGIPKEIQNKIFEMFYRPEQSIPGSGLGLYLVQQVVHKLNGKVQVQSEINEGSTFYISLPNNRVQTKTIEFRKSQSA